jgi:AcrR family transcriptional regulator
VSADVPLIERKQRQARQRIVAAADELFAAHGFEAVSVNDIAERAEVGRTTFFRHFGDKQEVVFAREQELLDLIAHEQVELPESDSSTLSDALRALESVLVRLLERMTADRDGYQRHLQLIDDHPELAARDAVKAQGIALRLRDLLIGQNCPTITATLAAELAIACYWTARHTSPDPKALVGATRTTLRHVLELGAHS